MKLAIAALLVASAVAFAPAQTSKASTALNVNELELGVTEPLGVFDPLRWLDSEPEAFERRRALSPISFTEIKPKPDPVHGVPCTRSSHGISMVRGGTCLVLYGGEHVARTPLDDAQALWTCNKTGDDEWQWKCCSDTATTVCPPPRVAHTQVAVGDQDVYVFGGRAGITMDEPPMNDLWKLDTETLAWTKVEPTGSPPSPRSFHRMVAIEQSIYIFGGYRDDGRLADLFQFDLKTNTWHELGASPLLRGRGGANLLVLENKQQLHLAVIAGFAGEETNDGHRFDVTTKKWQDDLMTAPEGLRPRSVCVAGSISGKAVLFGGEVYPSERGHEGAGGFENDVVLLDGTTGDYLETVRPSSGKSPEARGWSDGDVFGNSLYIFGGLAGDDTTPKRLNDLWRLDLE